MRSLSRAVAALAAVTALGAGCSSTDDWSQPRPLPTPVGALGAGFVDPSASPSPPPESTITPRPGSWDGVRPGKGYRVVLLTAGDDAPTTALVKAVRDWAKAEHVSLRTIVAGADPVPGIAKAVDMRPNLIVSAGNNLIDPLAIVTANHLDQQFLVIGAEIAEPTQNVTAADWSGASFRGEGLGASSGYDPGSFTASRCGAAIRAGVAAVLHHLTGIVLWLDQV